MAEPVIRVNAVSKFFKLPRENHSSIKSLFLSVFRSKKGYDIQKALDDVSVEIEQGDFFGIVGRNGSGKSTLLKLLAGIYSPSSGTVEVSGSLTPFIELGVGFNPELTGRENVYLNGALLGFNRREMKSLYKEIVEFAELGKFMDQKLKNYSSGMQVRLAFSIAIRASSDILILDEVLAVGDEAFQQKCIDVFERYKSKNQTIVLVTHDMDTIRRFCNKAVLLSNGRVVKAGDPTVIAAEYSRLNAERVEKDIYQHKPSSKNEITLKITDASGKPRASFEMFEDMVVEMRWPLGTPPVKNLGVAIHKNSGEYIFGDNTLGRPPNSINNSAKYKVKLNLGPGKYHVVAGLFGDTDKDIIKFEGYGPEFIIKASAGDRVQGLVRLDSQWNYED
jgi:ABC-2 type transport system ATP-binding protein